jgi:hypothetical protein
MAVFTGYPRFAGMTAKLVPAFAGTTEHYWLAHTIRAIQSTSVAASVRST